MVRESKISNVDKSRSLWEEHPDQSRRKTPGEEWGKSHLRDDLSKFEKEKNDNVSS